MGFYASYKAIFDRVKADFEAIKAIKKVITGEAFMPATLPMAIVNPGPTAVSIGEIGDKFDVDLPFDVILVIRSTEPEDWFDDIISLMGDVFDKIVGDPTLGGTVADTLPTEFYPGEIRFENKLYYGGVVSFRCIVHYTP